MVSKNLEFAKLPKNKCLNLIKSMEKSDKEKITALRESYKSLKRRCSS